MLTVGHRQRLKHITSSSHDIAAFRHWAFSVCFTALREQHKEETSRRRESGGEEENKENSRFYYADLIHKSSWLLSLEIQKKKKVTETGLIKRGVGTQSSSLVSVCFWPWREMIFLSRNQNHRLFLQVCGPYEFRADRSRFDPFCNMSLHGLNLCAILQQAAEHTC